MPGNPPPRPPGSVVVASTARLWLRTWHRDDLGTVQPIFEDPQVMRHVLDGAPWSAQRTRAWLEAQIASHAHLGFSHYAVVPRVGSGAGAFEPIGFCGVRRGDGDGLYHTGWRLARAWWARGLALEAAGAVQRLAFGSLGLPHLVATARRENVASERIMYKLGMRVDPAYASPTGPPRVRYRIDNPGRPGGAA